LVSIFGEYNVWNMKATVTHALARLLNPVSMRLRAAKRVISESELENTKRKKKGGLKG
jgi:hypothetical protein